MSILYAESNFITPDNFQIFTNSWLPEGDAKAVVIMVHGHAEHVGRYAHIGEFLAENQYAVFGLDHRGHGRSSGLRIFFETISQPVEDLKYYLDRIQQQHPDKKMFIYAHSMGTLIALMFALKHQDLLAGLIVSGTAIHAHTTVPALIITGGRIVSQLAPKARLIRLGEGAEDLTHDEAAIENLRNDPLVDRGNMRIGMAATLIDTGIAVEAKTTSLRLPLCMIHGADDKITPLSGAQHLYVHASSTDKTLKIYPNMRHEPHHEIGKEAVLEDLRQWLDERT